MPRSLIMGLFLSIAIGSEVLSEARTDHLPQPEDGWSIELVLRLPQRVAPSALVSAPDGTVYLGQASSDSTGAGKASSGSVSAIRNGKVTVWAAGLQGVKGLEWSEGTLYVAHGSHLTALRDTDGGARSNHREDLVTGLGPEAPGLEEDEDHGTGGICLGLDGYLYIAVGDKGIVHAAGKDGKTIRLSGGGVVRVRTNGTGLEVVSTGERNPRGIALEPTGEIFTFGAGDPTGRWNGGLNHHIVGGHYGYPYSFLTAPFRALPVTACGPIGEAGQGVCYNEAGLPDRYHGNLFFCDPKAQAVRRYEISKAGGTFAVSQQTVLVTRGQASDFHPTALAVTSDGTGFWLADRANPASQSAGTSGGRLYRLTYSGTDRISPRPRPEKGVPSRWIAALDHPALSVRLESQLWLSEQGAVRVPALIERLESRSPEPGRLHALWALDAIGTPEARRAIRASLRDPSPQIRLQAARSSGIRTDHDAVDDLTPLLVDRNPAVRREAAIALGKIGDRRAIEPLLKVLADSDRFAAWSIQTAIRRLGYPEQDAMVASLMDPRRREHALNLADESWSVPVVQALVAALNRTVEPALRGRLVANLASQYRKFPDVPGEWHGANPLTGPFPRKTLDWDPEGMRWVVQGLRLGLADADHTVRFQAIVGLAQVGTAAMPLLLAAVTSEPDPENQALIVEALGATKDATIVRPLIGIMADPNRAERVRAAALDVLARFRGPEVLRARLSLIYDDKAPETLVARALPPLARDGILPLNDLATFLESRAPIIRASALISLNVKEALALRDPSARTVSTRGPLDRRPPGRDRGRRFSEAARSRGTADGDRRQTW